MTFEQFKARLESCERIMADTSSGSFVPISKEDALIWAAGRGARDSDALSTPHVSFKADWCFIGVSPLEGERVTP